MGHWSPKGADNINQDHIKWFPLYVTNGIYEVWSQNGADNINRYHIGGLIALVVIILGGLHCTTIFKKTVNGQVINKQPLVVQKIKNVNQSS